jgi:hypothetical protein
MRIQSQVIALCLMAAVAKAAPTPPAVSSIAMTTPTVNVALAPAVPGMKIAVTAPGGVRNVSAFFSNTWNGTTGGCGYAQLQSVQASFPGPFVKSGTINLRPDWAPMSRYTGPSTWYLQYLTVTDFAGQTVNVPGPFNSSGLLTVSFATTNSGKADTTPPVPVSSALITKTISLSAAKPWFHATVRATDDLSGFAWAVVVVASRTGQQAGFYVPATASRPALSQTLTIEAPLPAGVAPDSYYVKSVVLGDAALNEVCDSTPSSADTLPGAFLTVTN